MQPTRNLPVRHGKLYVETMSRMKAFLDIEGWPRKTLALFFGNHTISFSQRLGLVCFLSGNGVSHGDIQTLLQPRLRDHAASLHMSSILKALREGTYDDRWYYFDVSKQDLLYLSGRPFGEATWSYARQLNAWEAYASQHRATHCVYPSLRAQHEFFGPTPTL